MSTVYASVRAYGDKEVDVDAYQMSRRVKLVVNGDYANALSFESDEAVAALIAGLELARAHCWAAG